MTVSGIALESLVSDLEAVEQEPALPPAETPPPRYTCSWLVQLRDGRLLRVDADTCRATNGILEFWLSSLTGGDFGGVLIAAFEYGDWKRVAKMDRETGENAAWVVLKERKK